MRYKSDTIAALATGQGGAIAVVRVSGPCSIEVVGRIFRARNGGALDDAAGYTVHFGEIVDRLASQEPPHAEGCATPPASQREIIDEVLVTVFRAPHSYTGEDAVEISCHASTYVTGRILQLLFEHGARPAEAGEFTVRAFMAGKMDLSQAEAVADLIASSDRAAHSLAMEQMKGGYSSALGGLRDELVELAALLELELDFGEEDVEFASRVRLAGLAGGIAAEIERLAGSFALGNAVKEGVPVAIVGRPNAGKSTLLNALVGDDRAMVSDIAGTTRDRIEERVNIGGVTFRFIDTAGLRETDDRLEKMGIDRTLDAVAKARIVLLVVDGGEVLGGGGARDGEADVAEQVAGLKLRDDQKLCVVVNKMDTAGGGVGEGAVSGVAAVAISARTGENLDALTAWLAAAVDTTALYAGMAVVSNARHFEALTRAGEAVERVLAGLGVSAAAAGGECAAAVDAAMVGVSADLLAEDVREVLYHLGAITGQVTSDEVLGAIFSKFCIGK